jgi:hypothetical protein
MIERRFAVIVRLAGRRYWEERGADRACIRGIPAGRAQRVGVT